MLKKILLFVVFCVYDGFFLHLLTKHCWFSTDKTVSVFDRIMVANNNNNNNRIAHPRSKGNHNLIPNLIPHALFQAM